MGHYASECQEMPDGYVDQGSYNNALRRIAELEFMLSEVVYLHSDGTVRVSWKPDVDLTDKVPGIEGIAKPVVPLSEHLRG